MQKLFIIIHYCLVFYFELTKVRLYRGITKYIFRNLGIIIPTYARSTTLGQEQKLCLNCTGLIHSNHRFSSQKAENGGLPVFKPRQTTKNATVEPQVVV